MDGQLRILVTGAGGFMGANFIKFLHDKGHFVRGVDKAFRKERRDLYEYADEIIYLDLRDLQSAVLACDSMDYVIHLAADMGGVEYFHNKEYGPYINNMQIDLNMLRAAQYCKIKRFYYSSSACSYPIDNQWTEGQAPALSELQLLKGNSDQLYGWQKLQTTLLCIKAPFDARVGVQHTIYGPYQEIEGERMKFPTAIATKVLNAKKNGGPIEIWGNGKQLRTFTYIDDAMEKIYRVLMSDVYLGPVNIGDSEIVSVTDVAKICCEIVGVETNFTYTNDKPSGVISRGCDNSKFELEYKYTNQVTLREGFKRLIEWIQTHEKS